MLSPRTRKLQSNRPSLDAHPLPPLQCTFIMRMHMLNPITTREFSAQKLEDTPEAGPGGDAGESSDRWLVLAVSSVCVCSPTRRSVLKNLIAGSSNRLRSKLSVASEPAAVDDEQ